MVSRRDFLKYSALGAGGVAVATSWGILADRLGRPEDPKPGPASPSPKPDRTTPDPKETGGPGENGGHQAPRPGAHSLFGAFVDPVGYPSAIDALAEFESMIGRRVDVTRHYIVWDRALVNDYIEQSAAGGRMPLIAWQAKRVDGSLVGWGDIANGAYDRELRRQARLVRAWGGRAYFVFNHEPENDPAGTAADFTAAFDHARRVFDAIGARKLRWVCTLMRGTYQGVNGGAHAWTPRGADLLGADGYNRGACNEGVGWESFESIFSGAREYARSIRKDLVVEEWGCVEADACGGAETLDTKGAWLRAAGETIKSWPEVEATVYTHALADYNGNPVDFRVTSSRGSLRAFKQLGHERYFTERG